MPTPTISPKVITFRFPKPTFLSVTKTDQKVPLDWLCYLLGETLLDEIPLASISIKEGTYSQDMSDDLILTIDDADKDNVLAIIAEINQQYDKIWDNEIFRTYNASKDRGIKYAYRITDSAIHIDLHSEPTGENDD